MSERSRVRPVSVRGEYGEMERIRFREKMCYESAANQKVAMKRLPTIKIDIHLIRLPSPANPTMLSREKMRLVAASVTSR